eukprot:9267610-Pyramimonas_sp.AAC.1
MGGNGDVLNNFRPGRTCIDPRDDEKVDAPHGWAARAASGSNNDCVHGINPPSLLKISVMYIPIATNHKSCAGCLEGPADAAQDVPVDLIHSDGMHHIEVHNQESTANHPSRTVKTGTRRLQHRRDTLEHSKTNPLGRGRDQPASGVAERGQCGRAKKQTSQSDGGAPQSSPPTRQGSWSPARGERNKQCTHP